MPGFDGTGPRGFGPMTGRGRGFCIVPLSPTPPTNMGTGCYSLYGVPQDIPYTAVGSTTPGDMPFAHPMTREQERDFLKNRARAMRDQLERIEARIQELESQP